MKRGTVVAHLHSVVSKSCEHKMRVSLDIQVKGATQTGYPEGLILSVMESQGRKNFFEMSIAYLVIQQKGICLCNGW